MQHMSSPFSSLSSRLHFLKCGKFAVWVIRQAVREVGRCSRLTEWLVVLTWDGSLLTSGRDG
jgi:hypothetical protein